MYEDSRKASVAVTCSILFSSRHFLLDGTRHIKINISMFYVHVFNSNQLCTIL